MEENVGWNFSPSYFGDVLANVPTASSLRAMEKRMSHPYYHKVLLLNWGFFLKLEDSSHILNAPSTLPSEVSNSSNFSTFASVKFQHIPAMQIRFLLPLWGLQLGLFFEKVSSFDSGLLTFLDPLGRGRDVQPRSGPDRDHGPTDQSDRTGPDRCLVWSRFDLGLISMIQISVWSLDSPRPSVQSQSQSKRVGPIGWTRSGPTGPM